MVKSGKIKVGTRGGCDIVNITEKVAELVAKSGVAEGVAIVFNVGSTAGVTTIEYEPGLVRHDMAAAFERIAPEDGVYEHEKTWNDDNGHAHVRASLMGPSVSVPVIGGQLALGSWQQIALFDFDTRRRERTVICQIIGEPDDGK